MRWARAVAPWLIHTSIQAAVFNWELCEVLVYRFWICLILTCIVCSLFPVKNITHDKFDNVDYLCWVTKIYGSCWLLFTFLLCHWKSCLVLATSDENMSFSEVVSYSLLSPESSMKECLGHSRDTAGEWMCLHTVCCGQKGNRVYKFAFFFKTASFKHERPICIIFSIQPNNLR